MVPSLLEQLWKLKTNTHKARCLPRSFWPQGREGRGEGRSPAAERERDRET